MHKIRSFMCTHTIYSKLYVHVTIYLFINTENFTTHSSPIVMSILYCITYQYCYGYFKDKGSKYRRFSHELIFILCILHMRIKMCSYFCLFGELSKKLLRGTWRQVLKYFSPTHKYSFYSRLLLTQCQSWFFFCGVGRGKTNFYSLKCIETYYSMRSLKK